MLILARRPGERVVIGDDVLVTVMEISGNIVRLGIAAPQGVSIYREEIWLAVKEENAAAAAAQADALPSEPVAEPPSTPIDVRPAQAGEQPSESAGEHPPAPASEPPATDDRGPSDPQP